MLLPFSFLPSWLCLIRRLLLPVLLFPKRKALHGVLALTLKRPTCCQCPSWTVCTWIHPSLIRSVHHQAPVHAVICHHLPPMGPVGSKACRQGILPLQAPKMRCMLGSHSWKVTPHRVHHPYNTTLTGQIPVVSLEWIPVMRRRRIKRSPNYM